MQKGGRRPRRAGVLSALFFAVPILCLPVQARADDGHVEQGAGSNFKPDRDVVSAPILEHPIYGCADTVVVKGFAPHAKLQIFVDGVLTPSLSPAAPDPSGQVVKVSIHFTVGQTVTAKQVKAGVPSKTSNTVAVTDYKADYPNGLPQPQINPATCLNCGAAVGVAYLSVIPGSNWTVFAQDPIGGGNYGPKTAVGSGVGYSYADVSPHFKTDQKITVQSQMCTDKSQPSDGQIVQSDPGMIPEPTVDPFYKGADTVVVAGPGGGNLLDGATLTVFGSFATPPNSQIGGQATPGPEQTVGISPEAPGGNPQAWAIQALCSPSKDGPKQTGLPCSSLPAAKIRPVLPGDTKVSVISFVQGSEIKIYAVGGGTTKQIGDGGGPEITLTEPVKSGDTIFVVQSLGDCQGTSAFVIAAGCAGLDPNVCSGDWPAFRHSGWRDGQQTMPSVLTNPDNVRKLKQAWIFTPPAADKPIAFKASPIVFQGRVFIGNGNGRLYALDATHGTLLWEYPKPPAQALLSKYSQANGGENPSSRGLAASATIALHDKTHPIVVFGAPDPSLGAQMGSGRLFALDPASGTEIWKSPEIAVVNGLTSSVTDESVAITQRHEQFGYSSPLALGHFIYVGIADHGDDPIQNGRVVAVDADSNGSVVGGFTFVSTSSARGGDVWSSVAGGLDKNVIAVTTGNSRSWGLGSTQPQPSVDNALSMLGLNASTGTINWKLRAVPFDMDMDPDWAAGPALLDSRCGHAAASTQKDGWTYAAQSNSSGGGSPKVLWQFPPTGIPFTSGSHDDTRYIKPGAGWNDTYITMDGGYELESMQAGSGFTRLHALDVCAPSSQPVRWIADIPHTTACPPGESPSQSCEYQLGSPTVTGGIVFVGTPIGNLIALADPSVYTSALSVCSNPAIPSAQCAAQGHAVVPRPIQLLDLPLGPGFGPIQTEPVIAGGAVYVAGDGGQVIKLTPTGK
jgi:outer membrane protein assembly factor BamB